MTVKRMTFLQELLSFVGLEGRLHLEWISSAEAQKFVQVVTGFTDRIKSLGPSPIKGHGINWDMMAPLESSARFRAAQGG